MANIVEQENAFLHVPALKMRHRLQSAPEKLMKTPAKKLHTPLPSGRKALANVNKMISTPAVNAQEKKLHKPQESKVKPVPQIKVEEYPEIESFHPYDPLEFEKYSIPEDLILLGNLALPGLACLPPSPQIYEEEKYMPFTVLSPMKMPRFSACSELDDFLQTIDELAMELPPESDLD
ncbi:securin [Genypterus blacodes]|uniref:securin n=1 Tax=Genypterus blacodes TaxID=154954 RepID=UPI003F762901